MIAVRRSLNGPRLRAGVALDDKDWTLLEDGNDALLSDPGVIVLKDVKGEGDPRLRGTVRTADAPEPSPEKEVGKDEVEAYVAKRGLTITSQKAVDALNGENDRLKEKVAKLEKSVEDREADVKAEKEGGKQALSDLKAQHEEEIKALKTAHAAELERSKAPKPTGDKPK